MHCSKSGFLKINELIALVPHHINETSTVGTVGAAVLGLAVFHKPSLEKLLPLPISEMRTQRRATLSKAVEFIGTEMCRGRILRATIKRDCFPACVTTLQPQDITLPCPNLSLFVLLILIEIAMAITIGIAGITGKFARLVVSNLLQYKDVDIRGFCRDPAKLPRDVSSSPRVTVVQGNATDRDAIRQFAKGCHVIVCCYLGDDTLMTDGQKLLVDACELEKVERYVASDYCLDFTKLEYGQHPAKDPMKKVKAYLEEEKKSVKGVHVLIGAFMETFWSKFFGIFDADNVQFSYYGTGDELWESTTYGTAAEYVAAIAADRDAVGMFHCESNSRS